jgi:hypothetical protein
MGAGSFGCDAAAGASVFLGSSFFVQADADTSTAAIIIPTSTALVIE